MHYQDSSLTVDGDCRRSIVGVWSYLVATVSSLLWATTKPVSPATPQVDAASCGEHKAAKLAEVNASMHSVRGRVKARSRSAGAPCYQRKSNHNLSTHRCSSCSANLPLEVRYRVVITKMVPRAVTWR